MLAWFNFRGLELSTIGGALIGLIASNLKARWTMTEDDLYRHIYDSAIFKRWHWFRYHFELRLRGWVHPFADSIVRACLDCERRIPGFARAMMDALAAIGGGEKDRRQYEQLMQRLAELLVIRQAVTYPWDFRATFRWEPTAPGSKKNPELIIEGGPCPLGLEVKAPSLLDHIQQRVSNPTQLPSRVFNKQQIDQLPDIGAGWTKPRDNPLKDFLISSEAKFAPFKASDVAFRGLLIVVWDDFVYEPISSLIHPKSGLFTENSFAKDASGQPLRFPSVDAVILVRHFHQFVNAAGDRPLIDQCRGALDYGRDGDFPPKAIIGNPCGSLIPMEFVEAFQAYPPSPEMGAEYVPSDLIWWI